MYGFDSASKAVRLKDGTLLVAMLQSGEILNVTDKEGKVRAPIAKGFAGPVSMELVDQNTLYVIEAFSGNISRLNLAMGERKVVATGLAKPTGTALSADGKILVVEVGQKRLVEVDPESGRISPVVSNLPVPIKSWGPPIWTLPGVAVSPSGAMYVSGDIENAIYKITRE